MEYLNSYRRHGTGSLHVLSSLHERHFIVYWIIGKRVVRQCRAGRFSDESSVQHEKGSAMNTEQAVWQTASICAISVELFITVQYLAWLLTLIICKFFSSSYHKLLLMH